MAMKMAPSAPFSFALWRKPATISACSAKARDKSGDSFPERQSTPTPLKSRAYAGATSNCRRSASHEVEDDGNCCQYQQDVNEECGDMENEKASQPQQQQNEAKN
jgi:hypothetical protein